MKIKLFLFSLIIGFFGFAQTKMTSSEIVNFKKSVINEVKQLATYSTDFTETKHLSFLKTPSISTGSLYLKSPNKVVWKYIKPEQTTILFAENKIILKKAGKKNTTDLSKNKGFQKLNDLVLGSFNGDLFNSNDFTSVFFKSKNARVVQLNPKEKQLQKFIKQVVLTFDNQSDLVSEVKMIQPSGDYTLIKFSNKKINPKLEESLFK